MAEYNRRDDLIGWIPGDQAVNTGALAEEMARLTKENARFTKENAQLREQLTKVSAASVTYNGLTFEEMYQLLAAEKLNFEDEILHKTANIFGDSEPSLLHALWLLRDKLRQETLIADESHLEMMSKLERFGLINLQGSAFQALCKLNECGQQFLLRLMLKYGTEEAKKHVIKNN